MTVDHTTTPRDHHDDIYLGAFFLSTFHDVMHFYEFSSHDKSAFRSATRHLRLHKRWSDDTWHRWHETTSEMSGT